MPAPADISKIKVHLKLSVARLRLLQQKKVALSKQARRELALQLIPQGKLQSARIRVENIIADDIYVELLEILELYCELVLARIGLLDGLHLGSKSTAASVTGVAETGVGAHGGLEEAIFSLMYAAPRVDVKELVELRRMLVQRYGKQFDQDLNASATAAETTGGGPGSESKVSEKVLGKLRFAVPDAQLVTSYLREIARAYGVDFHNGDTPPESVNDDDEQPGHGQAERVPLANPALVADQEALPGLPSTPGSKAVASVSLPSPSTENPTPRLIVPKDAAPSAAKIPKPNGTQGTSSMDDQSFDALMSRFEKLKRG
jgi:vacuolar protein sorting-associated protein IST1